MNKLIEILHKNNLKGTHAREVILEMFLNQNTPIAADEIFIYLIEKNCETDRATVYRILDAFLEKGILSRVEFQDGKARYEIAGSDHHHLICTECASIEDIADCGIETWVKDIRDKKGFIVKRHAFEFYGICMSCQR